MEKKRVLITVVVVALLGILIYTQFKEWRNFDWTAFWAIKVNKLDVLEGILLIYVAYALRALRWQIFLEPLKKTSWLKLLPPTLIGFTGLALLGRAGEFIRPYLISKQEDLPVTSQVAVWIVERAFDMGAFFTFMTAALLIDGDLRQKLQSFALLPFVDRMQVTWLYLQNHLGIFIMLALAAALVSALIVKRLSSPLKYRLGDKAREFRTGLRTIQGPWAFARVAVVSLAMWGMIGLAYSRVVHSYSNEACSKTDARAEDCGLQQMPRSNLVVLMGSSMVGSMVQLPAVGGGSQAATIGILITFFNVKKELATSCGILLWLVTFMAVIPLGLALAHRAHLSLRKLSEESAHESTAAKP